MHGFVAGKQVATSNHPSQLLTHHNLLRSTLLLLSPMPKQSAFLEKNDFLFYLHLTQSEAAEVHQVSLSCFKRHFHQLRPRIQWSTKRDRIALRKAMNWPHNNILTQDLVDRFLQGTLIPEFEEATEGAVREAPVPPSPVVTDPNDTLLMYTLERDFLLRERETLMHQLRSQKSHIHRILTEGSSLSTTTSQYSSSTDSATKCTASNARYKGLPEFLDGPWKSMASEWEDPFSMRALLVCDDQWEIIAANDIALHFTGFTHLYLTQTNESWCSLLCGSTCKLEFVKTVLSFVFQYENSLSTTTTLISRSTGEPTKVCISINRYSEGYYIFMEKKEECSKTSSLRIGANTVLQMPRNAHREEASPTYSAETSQLLQTLLEYALQRACHAAQTLSHQTAKLGFGDRRGIAPWKFTLARNSNSGR